MTSIAVLGAQAGDEGKGKITDILAKDADVVVRFQGGNNAGHTIVIDGTKYKVHSLPSGVFYGKRNLIASGCVLNPFVIKEEIDLVKKRGGKVDLGIDFRTQMILDHHVELDKQEELYRKGKISSSAENSMIGTTSRGIGPAYSDKHARFGIRFEHIVDREKLEEVIERIYQQKKMLLEDFYKGKIATKEEIIEKYFEIGKELLPYITDVSKELHSCLKKNDNVLFEGAQGTELDIIFGTYPYCTSSHVTAQAIPAYVGISPKTLQGSNFRVIGVTKAYTTKVGQGPVPTEELDEELAGIIRERGQEYGTTTGRPRRVGYIDLVRLKESVRLNGFDDFALMKIDVLAGLPLKACVAYNYKGNIFEEFPYDLNILKECKPVYRQFGKFNKINKNDKELPVEVEDFISFMEDYLEVPVSIVSVGPGREETIVRINTDSFF